MGNGGWESLMHFTIREHQQTDKEREIFFKNWVLPLKHFCRNSSYGLMPSGFKSELCVTLCTVRTHTNMNMDSGNPQFIMYKHSVAILIYDAWLLLLLLFESLWAGTGSHTHTHTDQRGTIRTFQGPKRKTELLWIKLTEALTLNGRW